ncbi:MAG TPA: glutamyl-tRNA reductase [Opitutaceae bacterium]|nr:glutamyl-tRNA reductase [Opitutaceae bacterium]
MRRASAGFLASSSHQAAAPMMLPTLFLVGVTHRTAPFGFREKLALGIEGEATLAAELARIPAVREFAVLNTCNRVEIYGVSSSPAGARDVAAAFCMLRHVGSADFERFGFTLTGRRAVEHLLQVAAGLDSQILGETEIFGQVKRAYAAAQTRGSAGPVLNRFFQKAFQAAKHVRTNTGITTGQVSVANVAVDLAHHVFGGLSDARILLLGSGEMAEKSARAFQSRGARHVTVASRRLDRASLLAQALGAKTICFEQRETELAVADIVVCSTSAPGTILSCAAVRTAMSGRRARPLLLIDLAMPRDVDTAAAGLENVFLYNLDDLAAVAAKNRQARLSEAETGRAALAPRVETLWNLLQLQLATANGAARSAVEEIAIPAFLPANSLGG